MPGRRPSQQAPDVADFPSSLLMKHSHLPSEATGLPQTLYVRPWVPPAPSRPCFTSAESPHGPTAAAPQGRWGKTGQVLGAPRDGSSGNARAQDPRPQGRGRGHSRYLLGMGTALRGHHATSFQSPPRHPVTVPRAATCTALLQGAGFGHSWPEMLWAPQKPRLAVICSCHSLQRAQRTIYEVFMCH